MTKQNIYKIQLFRYQAVNKFNEELVIANFNPSKVNGFVVLLNKIKQTIK